MKDERILVEVGKNILNGVNCNSKSPKSTTKDAVGFFFSASQHAFYKKCILQKINSSCQDVDDTISSSLGPFVSRSLLVIKEYIFVQVMLLMLNWKQFMFKCE